jgi:two-component system cell cycle response regulator
MVLVANDQEWSARSLESILAPNGYAVLRAYTGRQAIDLARSAQPDIVIVDSRMTDLDGADVCRELRADPRFGLHTPILITTSGPAERLDAIKACEAGAWDYLGHPLDGELLLLKLATFLLAKREVDRERDESLLDGVTGFYNVRGLARRAREIGAEAHRHHSPLACVAVSTETGGALDERLMEELASRVAVHVGEILRSSGRSSDAIGRLGQSEFAIIAPATEASGAVKLVERLQQLLASTPMPLDGELQPLRLRAGYCAVPDYARSTVDAVEMMLRAATALRDLRNDPRGSPIRDFDSVPVKYVH